jgi:hypothetical protein
MRKFNGDTLCVDVPKKPKKMTGTRFASVLGLDKWNTDFKTWCAITRTYEDPFTDNIYTIAGKTIEPKIISYLNKFYFLDCVKSPTDIYGKDYFKKTYGDFFPDEPIFGGMWDALVYGENNKPETVIEIKTSKRVEDWEDGKAPIYYALQAALYATLLDIDQVCMVAGFLEDKDYEHPENFIPNASNTIVDFFYVSERFPDMKKKMATAKKWWNDHVLTGISPAFDEKKDADILKVLRTNTVDADADIESLLAEAEALQDEIAELSARYIAEKEARLTAVKDMIKQYGIQQFRPDDKKVEFRTKRFVWSIGKSITQTVDKAALKKDGLLDKYTKATESYKLNPPKLIQEEE